jgi:AraC-like DNA-binding protein
VRLTGAVYFTIDGTAPWVAETPPGAAIAPYIVSGVEHVIDYHLVVAGSCWGGVVGDAAVRLEAGDVIVFPQGDQHVMSSAPGMRGHADPRQHRAASRSPVPIELSLKGGGDERARVICGFLGCDARPFNPLLDALPRVLVLRGRDVDTATVRTLLDRAVAESLAAKPGGAVVLARLSELLFVEVVRAHVASLPPEQTGWFSALRDEIVGRALGRLHEQPAEAWTLEQLARQVGASRSVLAERFAHLVGVPPMQYLAQWRIQMAASLLRGTNVPLVDIADRVGYGSEAALSRAFKRTLGVSPAAYRRTPVTRAA